MQRHKITNDHKGGGIYYYKKFYKVSEPICFQSSVGNYIDEKNHYINFRRSPHDSPGRLKILLVGELAYNPERIYAFEEKGHKLYGLWIPNPTNFNTIGPLPFGNVVNIDLENWENKVREIQPDIIYALLNYHAVPMASAVLNAGLNIPFVWHFKEGPFYCRAFGTWNLLLDLYKNSDGQIYNNEIVKNWFSQFYTINEDTSFILDGDLPKKDWFKDKKGSLLSEIDGEIHTVVAGRPLGINLEDINSLALQKIHIHIYGDIYHNTYRKLITEAESLHGQYINLHPNCSQESWVEEFSKYDGGWLHCFKSDNYNEILRASWHDLNYPARLSTYMMAGIPAILKNNSNHIVATEELIRKLDTGIFFNEFIELSEKFRDSKRINELRENAWNNRLLFSFDYYINDLIDFFKSIIKKRAGRKG